MMSETDGIIDLGGKSMESLALKLEGDVLNLEEKARRKKELAQEVIQISQLINKAKIPGTNPDEILPNPRVLSQELGKTLAIHLKIYRGNDSNEQEYKTTVEELSQLEALRIPNTTFNETNTYQDQSPNYSGVIAYRLGGGLIFSMNFGEKSPFPQSYEITSQLSPSAIKKP